MKDTATIRINVPTTVTLQPAAVLSALSQILGVEGYSVVDGKLYAEERVGYNSYDDVPVEGHPREKELIARVLAYQAIRELI